MPLNEATGKRIMIKYIRFVMIAAALGMIMFTFVPMDTNLLHSLLPEIQNGTLLIDGAVSTGVKYSIEEYLGNKTAVNDYGFPFTGVCGDMKQWRDYETFHRNVITGKIKGKFLKYHCGKNGGCGGFGNRMHGISMGLLFSMLFGRVFLLDFTHPFDFGKYLLPNVIRWDSNSSGIKVRKIALVDKGGVKKYWNELEGTLLDPNYDGIIEYTTNVGMNHFGPYFGPEIRGKLLALNISSYHDYVALYGCAIRYLFTMSPVIIDSVLREQNSLGLKPGHFVSIHLRSFENGPPTNSSWDLIFNCSVYLSEQFSSICRARFCPVYLTTDAKGAREYAIKHYGDRIKPSTAYVLHIDHTGPGNPRLQVEEAFVGLLTDILLASRAAVFICTKGSTFSDVIESLGFFTDGTTFDSRHCPVTW